MKTIKFISILFCVALISSCTEKLESYSSSENKLGFLYENDYNSFEIEDSTTRFTFAYESAAVVVDTVWIDVKTLGFITDTDREFTIKQIPVGDNLKDAQPGKNYVAFDAPELKEYFKVKANQNRARFPIIVNRDPSLLLDRYYIKMQIVPNENFGESYIPDRYKTVEISDFLVKPRAWNPQIEVYFIGEYGPEKLKFMINSSTWKVDEQWFDKHFLEYSLIDMGYTTYLSGYYSERLKKLNKARRDKGLDLLREAPEKPGEEGKLVQFCLNRTPIPVI